MADEDYARLIPVKSRPARKRIKPKAIPDSKICKACNASYLSHQSLSIFCSKKCKHDWHNAINLAEARGKAVELRRVKELLKLRDKQEKAERRAMRATAAAIARAMLDNKTCKCGVKIGPTRRVCDVCAQSKARAIKKAEKVRRRQKERSAKVEPVDPIKVFELANWRCYLCGCDTPKYLRGTYEPNAPELEHVVPLAKGGDHSYANTECSCRACNLEKSDKTLDELLA